MVENILILGNGFDLAMGRQTSYGDFLRFLDLISFLLSYQEVRNQQLDAKNYDFLLEDFLEEYNSISVLTKEKLQEQIKSKKSQIRKKLESETHISFEEITYLESGSVEENSAISCLNDINFQEEFKFYEKLPDKVKLGLLLECLSNFCKNEQLENFFKANKSNESAIVKRIIFIGSMFRIVR
ncbi:MAG: AbiH family protein, partial [Streptococcus equinus]|nr:AbiH family protein [Streptococcus equinus]